MMLKWRTAYSNTDIYTHAPCPVKPRSVARSLEDWPYPSQGTARWNVNGRWRCVGCRRWVSATAGTLFARTHTPLTVWFEAAWRMTTSKNGLSALELQRTLGLGSYRTAWTMLHRFRLVMGAGMKDLLDGRVEVDETFIGGPRSGTRGRGAGGKAVVSIAVEGVGQRSLRRVRMKIIPNAKTPALKGFLGTSVTPGVEVITDGLHSYRKAAAGYRHVVRAVDGSGHQARELLPALHRVASFVKRLIDATHQGGIQPEHLSAYLDEFAFRFNRRRSKAPGMLFYRLIQAAVSAPPTTYRDISQGLVTRESHLAGRTGPRSAPRTPALKPLDKPWRQGPSKWIALLNKHSEIHPRR